MALRKPRFETYPGKDGQFYWRFVKRNGRITAGGMEGYVSEANVQRAVHDHIDSILAGSLAIDDLPFDIVHLDHDPRAKKRRR